VAIDIEAAAFTKLAFYPNPAIVQLNNLAADE